LDLLQIMGSRRLNHEALLRVMPQQRLLEIRAALLERLGRWVEYGAGREGKQVLLSQQFHNALLPWPFLPSLTVPASHPAHHVCLPCRHMEALRIYVHRLRQLPLAEAYCDRVYQRRQQQLREQRHAELAGALRRQWQQREAAAAATGGAVPAVQPAGSIAGAGASSGSGSMRSLQFGGSSGSLQAAGVAAAKLQPTIGSGDSSSSEDGADIYLLLVQASTTPA
jgi:hypothetical protein